VLFVDLDVQPAYRKRLLDPRGRGVGTMLPVASLSGAPRAEVAIGSQLVQSQLEPMAEIYNALVLGTRDYVLKNGFTDVVIGLSGGIDSSLVAAVAVDALGADRVHGVSMPSRYSSEGSRTDAEQLAENFGIDVRTIPIEAAHESLQGMLKESVGGDVRGLTDENLQSRIRGVTLMALSNEFGWLVLTTGNKSELAVGYSTLYGDSAGGFAVIKDVVKTKVYQLCEWRNQQGRVPVIPPDVLSKPPSAELRPDQKDQDSLPPYEILDPILLAYVEDDRIASEIVAMGYESEIVRRIVRLIDVAEYKRRQSPIGVRVTPKAFGRDRRVPITNHYSS
jgi:NAD+ synthase (glutamine-hydrolysing)